jgi:acyl-CoA reductase-like NAD-dependent aldehyde dehydrogenase
MTAITPKPMFIDGGCVASADAYALQLPYDGTIFAHVASGDLNTLNRAIAAAGQGFRTMAQMSNAERSDLLLAVERLVARDAGELERTLAQETGKPLKEARIEVERASQTLIASAMAARELAGEAVPVDGAPAGKGRWAMTIREPLGVIGAITPFNVPLNLALHKVGPALAGGNSVVHKPSELTPLSALHLASLFHEAGAPAGAYNVITGDGAAIGQTMVKDPRIRMITFTGSVAVGKEIRANAGLKRVTLELGGNCPVIVEPDADLTMAVERCLQGSFSNSGQVCISVQRIFVHADVAEEFRNRLCERAAAMRIGHPLDESTEISSLISEEEAIRVMSWIDDAVEKGARQLVGGSRKHATITPTVLADLPSTARMSCNEVFGPVVAVNEYSSLEEAIGQANATPYGLQGGIFTKNISRAFEAARTLQCGGILINDVPSFRSDPMPYGGTKESGIGREGPKYAIEEMTDTKLICWR